MKTCFLAFSLLLVFLHAQITYQSDRFIADPKKLIDGVPYIIAECDSGLSNRLRTMLSHAFLAKFLHRGAHLVMIWDINEACPGHFLQYFQPVANISFISNSSRHSFEHHALAVYPSSTYSFEQTLLVHDVRNVLRKRLWWQQELLFWSQLKLVPELETRVANYVLTHNICNCSAVHVRRTDLDAILNHKVRYSMDALHAWIGRRPEQQPIFLLTDNASTQQTLLARYGEKRILVYAVIEVGVGRPPKLRSTSLEHAVADIFVAAHAAEFRPASFSSLSDLVKMLKLLHWDTWCAGR
jgi:hypothetical protein